MRKLIEFLRDVKYQKRGADEFEEMKPQLTSDEIELIETIFQLMADIANWAAEQTLCAAGILAESREDKDVKGITKALGVFSKFVINPMLAVRYLKSLNISLSKDLLLEMLSNVSSDDDEDTCDNKCICDGECTCKEKKEDTFGDIQKEISDLIDKFNKN